MTVDEGKDLVALAEELERTRDSLRDAQKIADRVPGLEREIERLRKLEQDQRAKAAGVAKEAGGLEQRVRELESEQRGSEEDAREIESLTRQLEDERERAESLTAHNAELDRLVSSKEVQLSALNERIDKLQAHEEKTALIVRGLEGATALTR